MSAAMANRVVVFSADKVVYSLDTMGIFKVMIEKMMVNKSRGSVIPLFIKQKERSRLTITNTAMTRFMMSINDAVSLVFYGISDR